MLYYRAGSGSGSSSSNVSPESDGGTIETVASVSLSPGYHFYEINAALKRADGFVGGGWIRHVYALKVEEDGDFVIDHLLEDNVKLDNLSDVDVYLDAEAKEVRMRGMVGVSISANITHGHIGNTSTDIIAPVSGTLVSVARTGTNTFSLTFTTTVAITPGVVPYEIEIGGQYVSATPTSLGANIIQVVVPENSTGSQTYVIDAAPSGLTFGDSFLIVPTTGTTVEPTVETVLIFAEQTTSTRVTFTFEPTMSAQPDTGADISMFQVSGMGTPVSIFDKSADFVTITYSPGGAIQDRTLTVTSEPVTGWHFDSPFTSTPYVFPVEGGGA
jgi:hypothetical protein